MSTMCTHKPLLAWLMVLSMFPNRIHPSTISESMFIVDIGRTLPARLKPSKTTAKSEQNRDNKYATTQSAESKAWPNGKAIENPIHKKVRMWPNSTCDATSPLQKQHVPTCRAARSTLNGNIFPRLRLYGEALELPTMRSKTNPTLPGAVMQLAVLLWKHVLRFSAG